MKPSIQTLGQIARFLLEIQPGDHVVRPEFRERLGLKPGLVRA